MLHIILLLLKIIGILILCVLGLILLILLTTLLVPIRYRVVLEHGERLFYLKSRVNWLLHIIHVNITHVEGILHIEARLFGFVVYDNLKPKKPKSEKKAKVAKRKSTKRNATKHKAAKTGSTKSKAEVPQTIITSASKEMVDKSPELLPVSKGIQGETVTTSSQHEGMTKESQASNEPSSEDKVVLVQKATHTQRKSFFQKLSERIKRIKEKFISRFHEWKEKIKKIFASVSSIRFKVGLILNFLRDEMNKEGMHLTFFSLKRLLKHILPTKLRSKVIFGTGDPCSTGQALGAMSILYSFYGDKIQIIPDFEHNIFEGKHFARGRIRLVTILIIVVKLILDKRFKQLKNNFIILKEAL